MPSKGLPRVALGTGDVVMRGRQQLSQKAYGSEGAWGQGRVFCFCLQNQQDSTPVLTHVLQALGASVSSPALTPATPPVLRPHTRSPLCSIRQYELVLHADTDPAKVYTGEMGRLKSYENQKP